MKLPVSFSGTVKSGKKIGRSLGFPTANIDYTEKSRLIDNGVYIATLTLPCGTCINGIANVGFHPTFPEGPPSIEIHLLNFSGELYSRQVTVTLLKFLRPEIRFANGEELKKQVFNDIETAKEYFRSRKKEDIC